MKMNIFVASLENKTWKFLENEIMRAVNSFGKEDKFEKRTDLKKKNDMRLSNKISELKPRNESLSIWKT